MKGVVDSRSPLQKAIGSAAATKDVTFERGRLAGQTVTLRALPTREVQRANDEARKCLVDERGWSDQRLYDADNVAESIDRSDRDLEVQAHILSRAVVATPEPGAPTAALTPLFKTPEELAATLERDEVEFLMVEWQRFQRERSPITYAETPEAIEELIDALGKGNLPVSRLSSCKPGSLLDIATFMALRLRRLMSSPASGTSPSSEPSPTSSAPSDTTPAPTAIVISPLGSTP